MSAVFARSDVIALTVSLHSFTLCFPITLLTKDRLADDLSAILIYMSRLLAWLAAEKKLQSVCFIIFESVVQTCVDTLHQLLAGWAADKRRVCLFEHEG